MLNPPRMPAAPKNLARPKPQIALLASTRRGAPHPILAKCLSLPPPPATPRSHPRALLRAAG